MQKIRIGVLGASGYTGADLVRLAARHPNVEIVALTANTHAGKAMAEVFPHFFMLDLPKLVEWEKVDWTTLDAVFCGLPHGTTQEITAAVLSENPKVKVIDMSADFRLRDMAVYAEWYGHEHRAPELQSRGGVRADRALSRSNPASAARRLSRLLSDGRAARARADREGRADRCDRHRHRCQVRRDWRGEGAEAEHALLRSGGGAVALFGGQAPARAGDRAGDRRRRRQKLSP